MGPVMAAESALEAVERGLQRVRAGEVVRQSLGELAGGGDRVGDALAADRVDHRGGVAE